MIRCKENHPTPKLKPEEVDAIADIKDSIKDRADAFFEMEAFLPKKNGCEPLAWFIVCTWMNKEFHDKFSFFHSSANSVKLLKVVLLQMWYNS